MKIKRTYKIFQKKIILGIRQKFNQTEEEAQNQTIAYI